MPSHVFKTVALALASAGSVLLSGTPHPLQRSLAALGQPPAKARGSAYVGADGVPIACP